MMRWLRPAAQLGLLALFAPLAHFLDANSLRADEPSISVSGTAEIRVAPDEVVLRLGVETRDPALDPAVKQNADRTAAVLEFLKQAGIDSKDVQTDFLEIHPEYKSVRGVQELTPEYFVVRRNLGVRLRRVAKFDEVLTGVLRSGANYVLGIEFRTTDLRKHRDTARDKAIRAAKEKAVALAEALDAKVGRARTINEQTAGGWRGWSGGYANYNGNALVQNVSQAAAGGASDTDSSGNLAVGMISITATVQVTFALQ